MAILLAYLTVPLSWREILTRMGREAMADDIFGMSAQLSYYFIFALFPAKQRRRVGLAAWHRRHRRRVLDDA